MVSVDVSNWSAASRGLGVHSTGLGSLVEETTSANRRSSSCPREAFMILYHHSDVARPPISTKLTEPAVLSTPDPDVMQSSMHWAAFSPKEEGLQLLHVLRRVFSGYPTRKARECQGSSRKTRRSSKVNVSAMFTLVFVALT